MPLVRIDLREGKPASYVLIALVEDTREDWSFGNGIAQYLELPGEQWK